MLVIEKFTGLFRLCYRFLQKSSEHFKMKKSQPKKMCIPDDDEEEEEDVQQVERRGLKSAGAPAARRPLRKLMENEPRLSDDDNAVYRIAETDDEDDEVLASKKNSDKGESVK